MQQSSCAVSLWRDWEKCHVCLSGKGTLIKRLRARGALNLLPYFSCICMKWCLWNYILLRCLMPERNRMLWSKQEDFGAYKMPCPRSQSPWASLVRDVWKWCWEGGLHYYKEMLHLPLPVCFLRWVMTVGRKASACCSTTAWKMRFKHIKNTADDIQLCYSSPKWDKHLSLLQLQFSFWPSQLVRGGISLEMV